MNKKKKKKKRRGRKKDLNLYSVIQNFFRKEDEAASTLGVSSTTLKNFCRENGIRRWPFRKLIGYLNAKIRLQKRLSITTDRNAVNTIMKELHTCHQQIYTIVNPESYTRFHHLYGQMTLSFRINNHLYTLDQLVNPNFIPVGLIVPGVPSPSGVMSTNMEQTRPPMTPQPQHTQQPMMNRISQPSQMNQNFAQSTIPDMNLSNKNNNGVLPSFANVVNMVRPQVMHPPFKMESGSNQNSNPSAFQQNNANFQGQNMMFRGNQMNSHGMQGFGMKQPGPPNMNVGTGQKEQTAFFQQQPNQQMGFGPPNFGSTIPQRILVPPRSNSNPMPIPYGQNQFMQTNRRHSYFGAVNPQQYVMNQRFLNQPRRNSDMTSGFRYPPQLLQHPPQQFQSGFKPPPPPMQHQQPPQPQPQQQQFSFNAPNNNIAPMENMQVEKMVDE